jgi:asparagine synthase (glutamine-hydrolysing)
VDALLGEDAVRRAGLFDARAVAGLVRRCRTGRATGFRENQALVAVLSTQLWHDEFIERRAVPAPLPIEKADVVLGEAGRTPLKPNTAEATR